MFTSNTIDLSCPKCGRRPVRGIVPSVEGAYCQCESCGHIWLENGLRLTRHTSRIDSQRRRKSDRPAQIDSSDAAEAHGGARAVRRHPGEIALEELERRIARLELENALLRDSARTFADLAERLNAEVQRRRYSERRTADTTTPFERRKRR